MKTTYICGNCGARFTTSDVPRGCPICWSDRTSVLSSRPSSEEYKKQAVETVTNACMEVASHYKAIHEIQKSKAVNAARQVLRNRVLKGELDKVPSYKDFM